MEPAWYLLSLWTNWLFPTERSCFCSHSNCSVQECFVRVSTHPNATFPDLFGEGGGYGIYQCALGARRRNMKKDIFRPQGSLCVRVTYPIKQPPGGMLSHTSKYEYGNVGQSLCLCVCMCACFWTDRWFRSAPVVCANQGECQCSPWVANTHTHTDTQLKMHTLGL